MDTSETYIKMCDCPEVQKQWKPKATDCFYPKGDWFEKGVKKNREVDFIICNRMNPETAPKQWHWKGSTGHGGCHKSKQTWLPRQDQIQEMMGFGEYIYLESMEFSNAICGGSCSYLPKAKSFEQLWLRFYMQEKHKKKWDGEKWVA